MCRTFAETEVDFEKMYMAVAEAAMACRTVTIDNRFGFTAFAAEYAAALALVDGEAASAAVHEAVRKWKCKVACETAAKDEEDRLRKISVATRVSVT